MKIKLSKLILAPSILLSAATMPTEVRAENDQAILTAGVGLVTCVFGLVLGWIIGDSRGRQSYKSDEDPIKQMARAVDRAEKCVTPLSRLIATRGSSQAALTMVLEGCTGSCASKSSVCECLKQLRDGSSALRARVALWKNAPDASKVLIEESEKLLKKSDALQMQTEQAAAFLKKHAPLFSLKAQLDKPSPQYATVDSKKEPTIAYVDNLSKECSELHKTLAEAQPLRNDPAFNSLIIAAEQKKKQLIEEQTRVKNSDMYWQASERQLQREMTERSVEAREQLARAQQKVAEERTRERIQLERANDNRAWDLSLKQKELDGMPQRLHEARQENRRLTDQVDQLRREIQRLNELIKQAGHTVSERETAAAHLREKEAELQKLRAELQKKEQERQQFEKLYAGAQRELNSVMCPSANPAFGATIKR